MDNFLKNCSACGKEFSDLIEYMKHIKNDHRDLSPEDLVEMGNEHKWKFRS